MELLLKVGSKRLPTHPAYAFDWRDGQIIDIRQDGYYKIGTLQRKHHCVISIPGDYWSLRPSRRLYNENIRKYLVGVDDLGKYDWDYATRSEIINFRSVRKSRDWFIDFKELLNLGLITETQFNRIYDNNLDPGPMFIDRNLLDLLKNEDEAERLISKFSLLKGSVASGTYSVGSGLDYADFASAAADIASQLTGNLTFEHNDEETSNSSDAVFDTDTNSYLLKITCQGGDEHNGGAYGNGARVDISSGGMSFDETNDGDLVDIEISKLAFTNTSWKCIKLNDGNDIGTWIVERLLIKTTYDGGPDMIASYNGVKAGTIHIRNNILYFDGSTPSWQNGIKIWCQDSGISTYVENNTVDNFSTGIDFSSSNPTYNVNNNLVQGCTTDYGNTGYIDNHAKNVSEDSTSPDGGIYDDLNCHNGNSCFQDYANNDYRLDSGGDEISTLDNGDDLSARFTDDIIGTTRSTWYIGAYELIAADVDSFVNWHLQNKHWLRR